MDQVVFEEQLAPAPAIKAAAALAGSRCGSGLKGDDDDDHDACDDEFSSCDQLDPSTEKEREGGRKRDFIEEEWKNGP